MPLAKKRRILPILLGAVFLSGSVYADWERRVEVEWWHRALIHPDSAGSDYRFEGLSRDVPGAAVFFRAAYRAESLAPVRIVELEYRDVDFPVVATPDWIRPSQEEDPETWARVGSARGEAVVSVQLPAFRLRDGKLQILRGFRLRSGPRTRSGLGLPEFVCNPANVPNPASVLASGHWVKVSVPRSGVYRIGVARLRELGFSRPEDLSVWGGDGRQLSYRNEAQFISDPQQIPVEWVHPSGSFGDDSYALFFLDGHDQWDYDSAARLYRYCWHDYSHASHFFLTDSRPPLGLELVPPQSADFVQTTFTALQYYRRRDFNHFKTGRQWLSHSFSLRTGQEFTLPLANPYPGAWARVGLHLAAASFVASGFTVMMDGATVGIVPVPTMGAGSVKDLFANTADAVLETPALREGAFRLGLEYNKPSSSSNAWVRYLEFNVRQKLLWSGDQLVFHSDSVAPSGGNRLQIEGLPPEARIWDVDDIFRPQRFESIPGAVVPAQSRRRLVAFCPGSVPEVQVDGRLVNQNLHGITDIPNLLIVAAPQYVAQCQDLADLYRTSPLSQLKVEVVSTDQVYNEFSSGNVDFTAIRNLARMLYWRGGGPASPFRYILLVGKPRWDTQDPAQSLPNFQSWETFSQSRAYASDDHVGILDADEGDGQGLMDVAVGRYSIENESDLATILEKERNYHNPSYWADWMNRVVLLADDRDQNTFMLESVDIARIIETERPAMLVEPLIFDRFEKIVRMEGGYLPELNARLLTEVDRGMHVLNYTGHSFHDVWAQEHVLTSRSARSWMNQQALPIVLSVGCNFVQYDLPGIVSLGEDFLRMPSGGSIATIAANRTSYSTSNANFNRLISRALYNSDPTTYSRCLGDALITAKRLESSTRNKRRFTLIGNPALPLINPLAEAQVTSIFGKGKPMIRDTIKALGRCQIEASFLHADGSPLDGTAYFTIMGPKVQLQSLNVEGRGAVPYELRTATVFRGKARISGGRARIEFIAPADISTQAGPGLISMVGISDRGYSIGSNAEFTVGGFDPSHQHDTQGPEINLSFHGYGPGVGRLVLGPEPMLEVRLHDSSGINVSTAGLNHGITAQLLHMGQCQTFDMTAAYTADEDSFTRGGLSFRFHALEPGDYLLTVRAHDVHNNPSQETISFSVAEAGKPQISNLINYPNPFIARTDFYFNYTYVGRPCEVSIQIITPDGTVVRTLNFHEPNASYRLGPYPWDGRDAQGRRLGRGVYFYRVHVSTPENFFTPEAGQTAAFGKLLRL